jgi:asparagine synthase (glutamine-hydrolysing)
VNGLAPIEVATGIVFGVPRRPAPLHGSGDPAAALEAAMAPALRRGPCFVSFSGGRDSSAVLAAAVAIARREGLADPVPLTIRSSDEPHSDETEWQERVVAHLRLADWVRVDAEDTLDAVGPYARRVLERHGLLWPFNVHFHLPMLDQAAGGTLFTGIGGDELWTSSRSPVVRRRRRLLGYAPYALRRAVLAPREPIDYPWLTPRARRAAQRAAGGDSAAEPRATLPRMAWYRGMRSIAIGTGALERLAADAGAAISHPLLDRALWAAVAAAAPRAGFASRDDALRLAAGRLLPAEVVSRRSKAGFDRVFFHDHARAFIRDWTGAGVPAEFVDTPALRTHWRGERPDAHSLTLLQSAWLASAGDRVQQPAGRVRQ